MQTKSCDDSFPTSHGPRRTLPELKSCQSIVWSLTVSPVHSATLDRNLTPHVDAMTYTNTPSSGAAPWVRARLQSSSSNPITSARMQSPRTPLVPRWNSYSECGVSQETAESWEAVLSGVTELCAGLSAALAAGTDDPSSLSALFPAGSLSRLLGLCPSPAAIRAVLGIATALPYLPAAAEVRIT